MVRNQGIVHPITAVYWGLQVASQIPNIWKKNSTHPNEENRPRKGGANQKRFGRSYGKRFDGQIRDRIAESGDFGTIQNK